MKIASTTAWQIYDSRGVPTVEAEVVLDNGERGIGVAPSGASTGQFEALELRDSDKKRFRGKSVFKAIANIKGEIAAALHGSEVFDQAGIDSSSSNSTVRRTRAASAPTPSSPSPWPFHRCCCCARPPPV